MPIYYREGFKYQLAETYATTVAVFPDHDIYTKFVYLTAAGDLMVLAGFAFDGPSGPTVDTASFMRGSLIHDALYYLIRHGYLDPKWRKAADLELWRACREDGMSRLRAWYIHRIVSRYAGYAASPDNIKPVLVAPGLEQHAGGLD